MLIATVNNRSDHALRASFADRLHNSNRIAIVIRSLTNTTVFPNSELRTDATGLLKTRHRFARARHWNLFPVLESPASQPLKFRVSSTNSELRTPNSELWGSCGGEVVRSCETVAVGGFPDLSKLLNPKGGFPPWATTERLYQHKQTAEPKGRTPNSELRTNANLLSSFKHGNKIEMIDLTADN